MPIMLKDLLEAGVHFGHQTGRWNPKMKKFIFLERNGIYIIDLQKTQKALLKAEAQIRGAVSKGGNVMFVGTKPQAKETIREEAERCGMPWITERWLGGTLTNFQTIRKSLRRLDELEAIESGEATGSRSKKETLRLGKKRLRLDKVFGGIRGMQGIPALLFIVDTRREKIAVAEANRLHIPVVGMVDTNCDPDPVDLPIPANDDAIRSIRLIARMVSDAVIEAQQAAAPPDVAVLREVEQTVGAKTPAAAPAPPAAPENPPPAP